MFKTNNQPDLFIFKTQILNNENSKICDNAEFGNKEPF